MKPRSDRGQRPTRIIRMVKYWPRLGVVTPPFDQCRADSSKVAGNSGDWYCSPNCDEKFQCVALSTSVSVRYDKPNPTSARSGPRSYSSNRREIEAPQ